MRPLDDIDRTFGNIGGWSLCDLERRPALPSRPGRWPLDGQFDNAVPEPLLWRKLPFQCLLMRHRFNRMVHAKDLMVAGNHFARGARLALVEQDEVLDNIEE